MHVNWEMNKQGAYNFHWILFQIYLFLLNKSANWSQIWEIHTICLLWIIQSSGPHIQLIRNQYVCNLMSSSFAIGIEPEGNI